MNIDIKTVREGLEALDGLVARLTPMATALGGPTGALVAKLGDAALDIAIHAAERAEEAQIVHAGDDKPRIAAIVANLQADNDKLMAAVDAS